MVGMVRAVLVDVGGTLWPNTWPDRSADYDERVTRLWQAVPALTEREARNLVAALSSVGHPPGERQRTDMLVADAIATVKPAAPLTTAAVSTAMCLPAEGRVRPFGGTEDLLAGLARRGLRVVIVSNVMWRNAEAHRRDFDAFGLSGFVDCYVSSLDVGWRKPHPAFFEVALARAGCPAQDCVMVGDSEANDIAPARTLGMVTVMVAIEAPSPATTTAEYQCRSLSEAAELLFALADTTGGPSP
jgi:HAD superfamily hydrolase (TIGR01509 family)